MIIYQIASNLIWWQQPIENILNSEPRFFFFLIRVYFYTTHAAVFIESILLLLPERILNSNLLQQLENGNPKFARSLIYCCLKNSITKRFIFDIISSHTDKRRHIQISLCECMCVAYWINLILYFDGITHKCATCHVNITRNMKIILINVAQRLSRVSWACAPTLLLAI